MRAFLTSIVPACLTDRRECVFLCLFPALAFIGVFALVCVLECFLCVFTSNFVHEGSALVSVFFCLLSFPSSFSFLQRHLDLHKTLDVETERLQELVTAEAKTRFDSIQQVRDEQRQVADRMEKKVRACF